ncbi:hypothetical protein D1AOALGA4SA_1296 [Olavius algarvensis Delta 1 endosymbiont]|nr:hypothetical protein D1AOALGA4SA_1296 [Olavius algarvensis Delta 1 endosymbiont]
MKGQARAAAGRFYEPLIRHGGRGRDGSAVRSNKIESLRINLKLIRINYKIVGPTF